MEPKDLRNSNDELNTTPENTGDTNIPVDKPDAVTEPQAVDETADSETQPEKSQEEETSQEKKSEPVTEEHSDDDEEEELDEETANAVIAQGKIDYSTYTEVELINALRDLVESTTDEDLKDEIDRIKINFYKKHRANIEVEKAAFLADGGVESDYEPGNAPSEDDLKNLLR